MFTTGGMADYRFPTGLAEALQHLLPCLIKAAYQPISYNCSFALFFLNSSLHHSLSSLEERYNLSPHINCLNNVEEAMRKKNLHQHHSMALEVVTTLLKCLC